MIIVTCELDIKYMDFILEFMGLISLRDMFVIRDYINIWQYGNKFTYKHGIILVSTKCFLINLHKTFLRMLFYVFLQQITDIQSKYEALEWSVQ